MQEGRHGEKERGKEAGRNGGRKEQRMEGGGEENEEGRKGRRGESVTWRAVIFPAATR